MQEAVNFSSFDFLDFLGEKSIQDACEGYVGVGVGVGMGVGVDV